MAIKQMDAKELNEKLNGSDEVVLVDVREQNEWDAGHIPGAIFIPLSSFEEEHTKLENKDAEILLQCRSGKRSMNAARILEENGYTNLTNVSGGILEWQEEGFPVVKD